MISKLFIGALAIALVVLIVARLIKWASDVGLFYGRSGRRTQPRHSDLDLIAAFHLDYASANRPSTLSQRTWNDLDLDDVFRKIDLTTSEPGRQYLYHLLRSPEFDAAELARREQAIAHFATDPTTGTKAATELRRLKDRRAAYLVHLLYGDTPARPALWWLFPILTAASVACLALIAIWPRALIAWIGVCVTNVIVQVVYKPRVRRFVPALHELPAFVRVAHALGTLNVPGCERETRALRDGATRLDGLRTATSWLMFEPGQTNDLAASLYEYVNMAFLLDVNAFAFAIDRIHALRTDAQATFEALGYLDAVQSIARWRQALSVWTTPAFTLAAKRMQLDAMVHPLVDDAVANTLELDDSSLLITGSNMSGKSTFIRALGVNAVLAQTLHTVCARRWVTPMLEVRSSIGRTDSILEGKSYYLAEVESVLSLLRAKDDGRQHLFLLDEIFRGTNTTERIAAGAAVLRHLDAGTDIVVVATHDLELFDLLGDRFAAHHFREQVSGDSLLFDYRLQPGVSSTRNAIALLEVSGYPAAVIADALALVHRGASPELRASPTASVPRSR